MFTLVLSFNRQEVAMNLKEHLQLLVMMIPTLLLIAAVAASLAYSAPNPNLPPASSASAR